MIVTNRNEIYKALETTPEQFLIEKKSLETRGSLKTVIYIRSMFIELQATRSGRTYSSLVIEYRDMGKNKIFEKILPVFSDEFTYLVDEVQVEPNNYYFLSTKKVNSFWVWDKVNLLTEDEAKDILHQAHYQQ